MLEFQSSVGPKANCNHLHETARLASEVSILSWPEGQLQPLLLTMLLTLLLFQSSVGPKANCNPNVRLIDYRFTLFQSSVGPKANCN